MLKDYGYGGAYHDKDISVGVLLENPLDYGIEANTLVFSVSITPKRNGEDKPPLDNFSFYLIDENGHIYNTWGVSIEKVKVSRDNGNEPVYCRDELICVELKPEFLFQNLRLVMHFRSSDGMKIIQLEH